MKNIVTLILFNAIAISAIEAQKLNVSTDFTFGIELYTIECDHSNGTFDFKVYQVDDSANHCSKTLSLKKIDPKVFTVALNKMMDSLQVVNFNSSVGMMTTVELFNFFDKEFNTSTTSNQPRAGTLEIMRQAFLLNTNQYKRNSLGVIRKDLVRHIRASVADTREQDKLINSIDNYDRFNHKRFTIPLEYAISYYDSAIKEMVRTMELKKDSIGPDFKPGRLLDMYSGLKTQSYVNKIDNLNAEYLSKKHFVDIEAKDVLDKFDMVVNTKEIIATQIMISKEALIQRKVATLEYIEDALTKAKELKDSIAIYRGKIQKIATSCFALDSVKRKAFIGETNATLNEVSNYSTKIEGQLKESQTSVTKLTDSLNYNVKAHYIKNDFEDITAPLNNRINELSNQCEQLNNLKSVVDFFTTSLEDLNEQIDYFNGQALSLEREIADTSRGSQKNVKEIQAELSNVHIMPTALIVDSMSIEFNSGTIKNIWVKATKEGRKVVLTNTSPIPFSTKADIEELKTARLYNTRDPQEFLNMSSILDFSPEFYIYSEDYSPADTVIPYFVPDVASRVMYKEPITEIIRGKIFTDFFGMMEENPNGLVQTEISRKFNLWARHFKYIQPKPNFKDERNKKYSSYVGWFNCYEPSLLWSKIETKERRLEINASDSLVYYNSNSNVLHRDSTLKQGATAKHYVSTIDLLRYQYFKFKPIQLSLISIHIPNIKSAFHIDIGASWGRTALKDTLFTKLDSALIVDKKNYDVNTTAANLSLMWDYLPHPLVSISFGCNFLWYKMWDNRFEQAGDPDGYKKYLDRRQSFPWMINPVFNISIQPTQKVDGQIFGRFTYFGLLSDNPESLKQNFMQAQMGISFRIIKK